MRNHSIQNHGLSTLCLIGVILASNQASASSCTIDFNSKAYMDTFSDHAMGSQIPKEWQQVCNRMEVADTVAFVGSRGSTVTELPFSNVTYDLLLWDNAGHGGCIIPASGPTPAATSTWGNIGGGSFGCDQTKAIYWDADNYPRYVSTHVPGQSSNAIQPIAVSLVGSSPYFDLASFRVTHGTVDLCARDPNATTFTKPTAYQNMGVGVHGVSGVYDKFEVRFISHGSTCGDGQYFGTPAGVDDIIIQWP